MGMSSSPEPPSGAEQTTAPGAPAGAGREPSFTYAGRGRRLVAALIDGVVLQVADLAIGTPLWGYRRTFPAGMGGPAHPPTGVYVLSFVLWLLYFSWAQGRWGRTLGKRAMGISVVRARDGGPAGYVRATWRTVFGLAVAVPARVVGSASAVLGLLGLVDLAWILGDGRRQALHDKVAGTIVVDDRPGGTGPRDLV